MKENNWTVAYASVMGNMHVRHKIPCQDSCTYNALNQDWGIAVVSDGAGSYSNSHIGSELAVNFAKDYFTNLVEENKWIAEKKLPTPEDWQVTTKEAFQKVHEHLTETAEFRGIYPHTLACTLIVVIHSPDSMLLSYMGDGRAGYFDGKEWKGVMIPYRGEVANETIFLTSIDWEKEEELDKYIQSNIVEDNIEAFVLMSDGCEKGSFEINIYDEENDKYLDPNRPYPKFFNPNINGLKMMRKDGKTQDEINQLWASFLEKGTAQFQREPDDKTMILGVKHINTPTDKD